MAKYNFKTLLKEISASKIDIGYHNGNLSYEVSEDNYTEDLVKALKRYKKQIIQYYFPLTDNSNLMSLNTKGDKTPFFLINGESANYFLRETLGKEQPYYGFLHLGSDGEKIPFTDSKVMANNFVKILQAKKHSGPYILGGFSFGGIVAFEMANILQKQGHKVELLVLFDTYNSAHKTPFKWHKSLYKIIRSNLLSPTYYYLLGWFHRICSEFFILVKKNIPIILRNKYILHKYGEISKTFAPQKFDGDILLFRADESLYESKDLGWGGLSDNIEIVSVKGQHADFLSNKESIEVIKNTIKSTFINLENKKSYEKKENGKSSNVHK